MKQLIKALALVVGVASISTAAQSAPINMRFDFSGGFDIAANSATPTPSGQLILDVIVESTTPDLNSDATRGRFAISDLFVTSAALGLSNESVASPGQFFVNTFTYLVGTDLYGGIAITGNSFNPDIGWNDGPFPSFFMSDINDLTTLPLGTIVAMKSTFFIGDIDLANGTNLAGSVNFGGPDGTFSVVSAVPLPASLPLMAVGIGLLGFLGSRRRRTAA